MLISFTSLLLQGVSNEKQRRVHLAMTEKRGIAAIWVTVHGVNGIILEELLSLAE